MSKRWYVVQAFSGYEGRVQKTLLEHIKTNGMEEHFGEILVPTKKLLRCAQVKNANLSVNSFQVMC